MAIKRFPHGSARFEQAGSFAPTRLLGDVDENRGRPSRVLEAARASKRKRASVALLGVSDLES
jgi:hypothetical protein